MRLALVGVRVHESEALVGQPVLEVAGAGPARAVAGAGIRVVRHQYLCTLVADTAELLDRGEYLQVLALKFVALAVNRGDSVVVARDQVQLGRHLGKHAERTPLLPGLR